AGYMLLVAPPDPANGTVFYFPGCGSERLHADVGLATVFLLLRVGVRVVLPPKHLCCGFPAQANAKASVYSRQMLDNTIVFNQIRAMLGDLAFDGCIVSCGTCRDALGQTHVGDIFDAPLADAVDFVLARQTALRLQGAYLYHQPCHDSLDGRGLSLLSRIAAGGVTLTPCCCSEAGTLALSRPDIAAAMWARKRASLLPLTLDATRPMLITNCPACLNGLGRQQLAPVHHTAVALADAWDASGWRRWAAARLAGAELIPI
ncbi:MAG: (Fe-S)-binding protein, partial [Desulfatitalea sp.]|nr:(Fe-S)-binding protein [Desulfatitalea sp.]NNK00395.1 (Fe-S)-binding protein [Desulfatitalea sp.]